MLDHQTVRIYPSEMLDGSGATAVLSVPFPNQNSNGHFALLVTISKPDSPVITKRIAKVDGKDPLQFISDLALPPTGLAGYKSLGPRVQSIVKGMVAFGGFDSILVWSVPSRPIF